MTPTLELEVVIDGGGQVEGTPATLFDVHGQDKAAFEEWIRSKVGATANTIRAYRQAVESLWTWLNRRHGGHQPDLLISLRTHEAQAYLREQLQAGLAARTLRLRITTLNSLYAYWARGREGVPPIKTFNPFLDLLSEVPAVTDSNTGSEKALSDAEQAMVERALNALPRGKPVHERHYWRARVIWLLATRLALRRAEIADLRVQDFRQAANGIDWKIAILGKGRHDSETPDVVMVPGFVIDDIRQYRRSMGLHPDLLPSDASHLVRPVTNGKRHEGLSHEHVAKIIKELFARAADIAEGELATHIAERLRKASVHWGRHTWFMNALQSNDIHIVSRAGRHKNIDTTMKSYVGTPEEDLSRVMGSGRPVGG